MENQLAALSVIRTERVASEYVDCALIQNIRTFTREFLIIFLTVTNYIFANQPILNFHTVSASLAMFKAIVKSCRPALFAFRMNMLHSIAILLRGPLWMLFFSMRSFFAAMGCFSLGQPILGNRLSSAFPISDLLSYYDSLLVNEAITASERLLIPNSPSASQQTVLQFSRQKLTSYILRATFSKTFSKTTEHHT